MLRTFLGGRYHIAAAITQLMRWWDYAILDEAGKGSKHHKENAKSMMAKGGMAAVGEVPGSVGKRFTVTTTTGERGNAVVNMTKARHHCSLALCSRLSYPCEHV